MTKFRETTMRVSLANGANKTRNNYIFYKFIQSNQIIILKLKKVQ